MSRKHIEASWAGKARDVVVNRYDLADEGRKYYKPDATKNMRGVNLGGFCFGKVSVSEVNNFTEPSDAMGHKMSRVTFTYHVTDLPEWAKSAEIVALDIKTEEGR